jgi:hypothetical protein
MVSAEAGDEVGHGWISAFPAEGGATTAEGDSTAAALVKEGNGSSGSSGGGFFVRSEVGIRRMSRGSYPDVDSALQAKCGVEENCVREKHVWNQAVWLPSAINFNENLQESVPNRADVVH